MSAPLKLLAMSTMVFLAGCTGPQASFSERMNDNFAFTAAQNTSSNENKCFILTKAITLPSGSVTYTIPAGRYVTKEKNSTGYFYYAPDTIKSSNWLVADPQQGIYISNDFSHGNLFGASPSGFSNRPLRGVILPSSIFSYIKQTKC